MIIHERIRDDGIVERTQLVAVDGGLWLTDDAGLRAAVKPEWVVAVMRRYGRPLDDAIDVTGDGLPIGDSAELRLLVYRSTVDAGPRDYAVLCVDGKRPIAALATTIAGALRYLADR